MTSGLTGAICAFVVTNAAKRLSELQNGATATDGLQQNLNVKNAAGAFAEGFPLKRPMTI